MNWELIWQQPEQDGEWQAPNLRPTPEPSTVLPKPPPQFRSLAIAITNLVPYLQGCTKRWAPGCVKLGEKVAFCFTTTGRRTQLFIKPGAHLLVHPCRKRESVCRLTCSMEWNTSRNTVVTRSRHISTQKPFESWAEQSRESISCLNAINRVGKSSRKPNRLSASIGRFMTLLACPLRLTPCRFGSSKYQIISEVWPL